MSLQDESKTLLYNLKAHLDYFEEQELARNGIDSTRVIKHMVARTNNLKIKMYREEKHSLPHIHIDVAHENHVASYQISNGKLLAGKKKRKKDKLIVRWIENNKDALFEIWERLQDDKTIDDLVVDLPILF